jgi:alpha-amylase
MACVLTRSATVCILALGLAQGCGAGSLGDKDSAEIESAEQELSTARTAVVHLFEWKWSDVATECELYLGPKGFKAVQVSPPNEHISGDAWWSRYQPVSYTLTSRSGNRAAFIDMVTRCKNAGVDVYADLVINHTANGSGTGVGGTNWSTRSHPMYSASDYHSPYCTVSNYQNAGNVQNCDLSGLPDLNTSSTYVQQTIAAYANDLLNLAPGVGVKGFRIDAAKHMAPADVAGIIARFNTSSYVYQEVIDLGGEAVTAGQYTSSGAVEEFKYSSNIGNQFKNYQIKNLSNFGTAWGFLASSSAMVFVDNHDNQRGHGAGGANVLTYKDGSVYALANVFMMAWPYGYPRLMSSYEFADSDQGPPSSPVHGSSLNCFGSAWKCEHRWRELGNMVGFRNAVDGTTTANWWDNGNDQIAFSRGNKGYVVINREGSALNRTFTTGLPAGTYCDVINGDFNAVAGTCSGRTITVASNGTATFNVDAMKAAAFHIDAIVSGSGGGGGGGGGFTSVYPSVYFRGTPNAWAAQAMTLVANNTWETTVTFGGASTDRFKFDIYANWATNFGDNNADGIAEQAGGDIYVTTAGTYLVRFNDSTRAYSASGSCTPNCTGKVCGSNGCGGSCGTCASGTTCNASGQCEPVPPPPPGVVVNFTCNNGTTVSGQSVYISGNHAALGNWDLASAVKLSPTSYPTWTGSLSTLPASTQIQWKCVKRSETSPTQNVVWQGGGNNVVTTPASGSVSTSGSF